MELSTIIQFWKSFYLQVYIQIISKELSTVFLSLFTNFQQRNKALSFFSKQQIPTIS